MRAVIDSVELVHAGNPAEDLGWFCVKAWRFGVDAPAAGLGSREELLAAYRAAGGADITTDELRWWEILGTLRWGVICMSQAWAHLSGAHRSVELAAVGRRVCEQEWDLLLLLAPDAASAGRRAARALAGVRSQPGPARTARRRSELLDAVRQFSPARSCPRPQASSPSTPASRPTSWASWPAELELGAIPADAGLAGSVAARLAVANPKYFETTAPVP